MIFKNHAHKFHELGVAVIPLNGKYPKYRRWEEWSHREQTEEELEWLIARAPDSNIGAIVGQKFCVLDIDTDDPRILQAIPYTPVRRRGRTGRAGCYFYRACNIPNKAGGDYPVDFLNHGRQVVLPPSVHPDTGEEYAWIGESVDFSDLPEITEAQIKKLIDLCRKYNILIKKSKVMTNSSGPDVCLTDAGRNNRLASVSYAMACDCVPEAEAVERLLSIDKAEHDKPWFSDPTEPHRGTHPEQSALKMYTRAVKKATAKGDRVEMPTIHLTAASKKTAMPMPKPRGLIKQFQDYCNLVAFGNQDALGIGGALAMMAVIASNRFRTRVGNFDVWPNIYVMNLAHSGFGKETPQRAIDEILMHTGLLGSATYKSGSSIVMDLAEQPSRLDVIDECAMILKAMAAREDYKADIVDVLSSLYSKSSTFFHGYTSKGDGKNFGACWNPCVNLLGSTTPQGFRTSVSKDMAAKGLLPRFLIFWQQEIGEFKRAPSTDLADNLLNEIRRRVRALLSHEQAEHPESRQKNLLNPKTEELIRYDPELIPMSDGAAKLIEEIQERYFNEGKDNPEGFESAFKNRFAQHVAKVALLDALGLGLCEINTDSVQWAHELVVWQWETVKELYELASAENDNEKDFIKVRKFMQDSGIVPKSSIYRKFSFIRKYRLDEILKQLEDGESVERVKVSTKGRPSVHYRVITD
jgi:hypothetical protein